MIGKATFNYPDFGTPDGFPEYTAHSGQEVEVIRQLTDDEADPEVQPMYEIRATDGWTGHVDGSELEFSEMKFVVVDESMLGCVFPNGIQMRAVNFKGQHFDLSAGTYPTPMDKSRMRMATRKDFDEFRVSSKGHL